MADIRKQEITKELKTAYMAYAMSVIVARALPDVRDGLKPVHRRVLWGMWDGGYTADSKTKKSANVVGEVMGKYHPHGDSSIYDALVRMAQDFSLRYPLVHGQGNFGCFTKDTKVKLTNGMSLSFEELVHDYENGKKHYTYTVNSKGLIAIAEIKKPRLTRKDAELVRVTLDNGEELRCTPDHRFMLRDGTYQEAKDLQPGTSLMSLVEANSAFMSETFVRTHAKIYSYGRAPLWETGLNKYFQSDVNLVRHALHGNHRVIRVDHIGEREDVYDLTIDGTHNFALAAGVFVHNSVDGDSPAAMRYTEARLARISDEILGDIDKETVDWQPNYDESRMEPKVLPAKLPNLLLNGTVGIAVGMATNIPPHNLREVSDAILHLTDNPDATNEDLLEFVKGPDFPTGGIIYDKKAIRQTYISGRGGIMTRAKTEITERKPRQFDIVITEIPYQVNKSELIKKIAELVQEKKVEGIRDVRDESDREGMRIVIELKNDIAPQRILNVLFKHTDLQKDFHMNMIALVGGIEPRLLSLRDVLIEYIGHRKVVIRRRTEFDLRKAQEREHILEGLAKALDAIDQVIATIKKSKDRDDAHANLMKKFDLSAIQSTAILEMRLQALAALERQKIEDELKEKRALIKELQLILKHPEKILGIIKTEVTELRDKYGDDRRTKVVAGGVEAVSDEDLIPKEETVITLSSGGYVKRLPPDTFHSQRRGGRGLIGSEVAEEDFLSHFVSASTHDNILFFTDKGRVFQTKVYEIPAASRTSKGRAIHNFLELPSEEMVSAIVAYPDSEKKWEGNLIMVTREGVIKKTALEDFRNIRKNGIIAIALKKGDALMGVKLSTSKDEVVVTTSKGQAIRFKESQARAMGRNASGIRAIKLKKGDRVAGFGIITEEAAKDKEKPLTLLVVMVNGFAKQTALKEYKLQNRGGSGIRTANITSKTGELIGAEIIGSETELLALSAKGQVIRTELSGVRHTGRAAQGVKIMNLRPGDRLAGVVII